MIRVCAADCRIFLGIAGFYLAFVASLHSLQVPPLQSLHFVSFRFISLHRCKLCMQRLQQCNDQVSLERVLCLFANFAAGLAKYSATEDPKSQGLVTLQE